MVPALGSHVAAVLERMLPFGSDFSVKRLSCQAGNRGNNLVDDSLGEVASRPAIGGEPVTRAARIGDVCLNHCASFARLG